MAVYRGVVEVKGKPWPLEAEGSPAGRTIVRSGQTVLLDVKPFIAKEEFDFRIGGTPVKLKWVQVGFGYECHVLADRDVVLSPTDRTGTASPPLSKTDKERKNARFASVVLIGTGLLFLLLHAGISRGDRYYPALIAMAPMLFVAGLFGLVSPRAAVRLLVEQRAVVATLVVAAALVSWFLFVPFYLGLFR